MDGFTYTNIFETKGIEYLAIIAFFLMLVPFWLLLNRQAKISKQLHSVLGLLTAESLKIPQGLFFNRFHTWTHLERTGIAKVGIDDLLIHLTGILSFRAVKKTGELISKGDLLAELERDGKLLHIYSPISGEVVEVNSKLVKDPTELNADPYVKGWMYKLKPVNWVAETNSYLLAQEATEWSVNELERFKDFLATSMVKYSPMQSNVILQDGGELSDQPLSDLPNEVWKDFQQDFLEGKPLCYKPLS